MGYRSKASKGPRIVDLVMAVLREHGPADDRKLAEIMRRQYQIKSASTRGRRAELVRAGEVERVGKTSDGHGLFDIRGIVRQPVPPPAQQRSLFEASCRRDANMP
jgi:hypothetical protein